MRPCQPPFSPRRRLNVPLGQGIFGATILTLSVGLYGAAGAVRIFVGATVLLLMLFSWIYVRDQIRHHDRYRAALVAGLAVGQTDVATLVPGNLYVSDGRIAWEPLRPESVIPAAVHEVEDLHCLALEREGLWKTSFWVHSVDGGWVRYVLEMPPGMVDKRLGACSLRAKMRG